MKIPTYDNYQENPSGGPSPGVRAISAPDVAGSQLSRSGDALARTGQVATGIATDMQRDLNEANTKKADNVLAEVLRTTVTGYTSTLGEQAVKGVKDARTSIEKAIKDSGAELGNDTQRQMYTDVAQRRMQAALGQVDAHHAQQTKTFHAGQGAARADSFRQDALLNIDNPQAFAQNKAGMMAEIASVARVLGKDDPAQLKELQGKALTQLHTEAIANLMATNRAAEARRWFTANVKEIDPANHDDLNRALETAGIRDDSLQAYLALQGLPYGEQVAAAEKQYRDGTLTAEVYDATVTRMDHGESKRKAREQEETLAQLGSAHEWILQNPGESILDLPNYDWAKSKGQLAGLQNFARTGGDPITDSQIYYDQRVLAAEHPTQFAKTDLMSLRGSLSRADFNSLTALQASVKAGDMKAIEENRRATTVIADAKLELERLGFDTTPNANPAKAKKLLEFTNAALKAVDDATLSNGGPLNEEQRRNVVTGVLTQGRKANSGLFSDSKILKYESDAFYTVAYEDVPTADRVDIESQMRAAGPEFYEQWGIPTNWKGLPDNRGEEWIAAVQVLYQRKLNKDALPRGN